MGILSSKPISYLGVDLSPDSIKVVELKVQQGKPLLATYGYTESKGDVLKGDFIANKNITSTLLKEVCDRSKVSTNLALAALPISSVFTSVIKLAKISKRDLEIRSKIKSLLTSEVKKILPKDLSQMTFDFNLIKTPEIDQADKNAVLPVVRYLITATENETVKQYIDIFKQANFNLNKLDIETFCLVRSLIGNDKSLIMIVDIGENKTTLSIVNLTIPVLNRSIQVGGSVVTKAISDSLNISINEAENYKQDLAIMMNQENMTQYPQPIENALSPIITEIKYLINNYYQQSGQEKLIDKIVLTGGGCLVGNFLDKFISQKLNIRTYLGDPWARVIYPEELRPVLSEIGPRFSVAVGLAMREII